MSSHHVVRENQEPALIMANLATVESEVVRQLLEWSPTLIVLEPALNDVLAWQIKFDVLICKDEHVRAYASALEHHAPVKMLTLQPGEDPLTLAFLFLQAAGNTGVNIVGVPPGDVPVLPGDIGTVTFYSGRRWMFIRNGNFEKWMAKGTQLSFHSNENLLREGLSEEGIVMNDGPVKVLGEMPFWVGETFP